jgi:type IV secretory pathway VirB2 component (pilin)
MTHCLKQIARAVAAVVTTATMFISHAALAAGSNMPWEQPLQQVLDSVQGPVAKILAVIIIIVTGLTLAFAASSFFLGFFSFGGGALIQ